MHETCQLSLIIQLSLICCSNPSLLHLAPEGPPLNVKAEAIDSRSARVSWNVSNLI